MRRDLNRWRLEVDAVGPLTVASVTHLEVLAEEDVQALGEQLLGLVDDRGCRQIMLDLGGIKAISSSMLGKILALYKRAKAEGGRLALCGVSGRLRESLEALQLTRLIPTFTGREEGLAALTPPHESRT
jgi:anti-anti-sigma factor